MDFMRILQSLEEFLYEAMSWVVFYPRALVRTVRHPVAVAIYTREQLAQPRELQFGELISPPLVLILTVIVAHVIELESSTTPLMGTAVGKELFGSEQGIIATRSLMYCIFALLGSFAWLRCQRKPVNRETLREPFYVHCYLLAPFVLGLSIASNTLSNVQGPVGWLTAPLFVMTCVWYAWGQTAIYARLLGLSVPRAFWLACRVNLGATGIVLALCLLLFGLP